MPKLSAGILLHRVAGDGRVEVLLVHPGGPFWARKDEGAWSIPKGEYDEGEDPAARAETEFAEELGRRAPGGERVDLGEVRQRGGKRVRAWAVRGDVDADTTTSNLVEARWPPGSDRVVTFPEVDRAAWFGLGEARVKLIEGQRPLLDRADPVRVLPLPPRAFAAPEADLEDPTRVPQRWHLLPPRRRPAPARERVERVLLAQAWLDHQRRGTCARSRDAPWQRCHHGGRGNGHR